jgi:class 3 adenylate cyclase/tetratricopeptide (TPR) repeat protein
MFVDVVDSTPLGEALDPEQIHSLMDRAIQLILAEVHRYEGTVNQFTGDGVMALFGAPVALEDAPRRAVLAGLAIQRALDPLHRQVLADHGLEFRMRIGIHTGPVVVGRIGDDLRMDYTAVGDTTNLADRIQRISRPGAVLISEATHRLASGFFDTADLGEMQVKGKAEPVRAFEVLRERAVSGRIEALGESGLTPLVGRERELGALLAAFDAADQGRGQVAFVVGEAGIGKSRLLHELRRQLKDRPPFWMQGQCNEWQRNAPFHAISDSLRRRMGIEDRDDDARALERLDEAQREMGLDLAWTLPYVRQLLSLPVGDDAVSEMDAITRRSETVRALQARFLRIAERQTLVMVIEDLHWIDPASEEFVGLLADSIPTARALIVLTHRPGYHHPFGDRSFHTRVSVQALSEGETAAMTGALLEDSSLPPELRRLITRTAEGNPFFIEEVTKSLVEEGTLRVQRGRVELATDISKVSVPDSIQDVLMARIDRLEEEPKRAIQVASVIGREFAFRLLERISEAGERVQGVVDDLRGLELIQETARHPELAFMFKHALTHGVAYESVLVQRRRTLHQIVGAAIEELYRDRLAEHYERLAEHFTQAEDWERAFLYRDLSAQKAADAYANQLAIEHAREALHLAERLGSSVAPRDRQRLEELIGEAAFAVSDFRASGEAYLRAADVGSEAQGSAANLARAAYSLGWAHDYARARDTATRAIELARSENLSGARAMALVAEDFCNWVIAGPNTVVSASRAVDEATRSGDAEAMVRALTNQAMLMEQRSEFQSALAVCERVRELAHTERMTSLAIQPLWFMGLSLTALGQYGRSISVLQEGVDLCDRIGAPAFKSRLLNSLGWCMAEIGSAEHARQFNQQGTELAREMVELGLVGAAELYANAEINLAGNRIMQGDPEGALEHLEPVNAELGVDGDPWMRWRYALHVLDTTARYELARGEPERALEPLDREISGARHNGCQKIEARALELRGRVLIVLDQRRDAEAALRAAVEIATRIEYPPVLWRALSSAAELARREGDPSGAERDAQRARRMVENLAGSVPGSELQRSFVSLGEQLVSDWRGSYR